jgi:hypothetical protein
LIRQAVAQTGAQQWNFNTSRTIPLASRRDDQFYYTGNDKQNLRFSRQGTGYLIQVTDPVAFDGTDIASDLVAGTLYIDWDCTFQTPQIEPAATEAKLTASANASLEQFEVGPGDIVTVIKPCDVSVVWSFGITSDDTATSNEYTRTLQCDLFDDPVEVTFGTTEGYIANKNTTGATAAPIVFEPICVSRLSRDVLPGQYVSNTIAADQTGWDLETIGALITAPAGCVSVAVQSDTIDTPRFSRVRAAAKALLCSGTGSSKPRSLVGAKSATKASVLWPACHSHLTSSLCATNTSSTSNVRELSSAVSRLAVTPVSTVAAH